MSSAYICLFVGMGFVVAYAIITIIAGLKTEPTKRDDLTSDIAQEGGDI